MKIVDGKTGKVFTREEFKKQGRYAALLVQHHNDFLYRLRGKLEGAGFDSQWVPKNAATFHHLLEAFGEPLKADGQLDYSALEDIIMVAAIKQPIPRIMRREPEPPEAKAAATMAATRSSMELCTSLNAAVRAAMPGRDEKAVKAAYQWLRDKKVSTANAERLMAGGKTQYVVAEVARLLSSRSKG